jgi:hypothetical protein
MGEMQSQLNKVDSIVMSWIEKEREQEDKFYDSIMASTHQEIMPDDLK